MKKEDLYGIMGLKETIFTETEYSGGKAMLSEQPKKLIIMNILDILRKYTDADHRLSQQDILRILREDYHMEIGRKAVKRNLDDLIDCGYEIEYTEEIRKKKNPRTGETEEVALTTDYYLERELTDSELHLLIDSVMCSRYIPHTQGKELVNKLEHLSNKYFRSRISHISVVSENAPQNRQLFLTIETLDEAISQGKKVEFRYQEYGTDKKLHLRKNKDGEERLYIVNPYRMVVVNGRYYLICSAFDYDNVSHYRLDRIRDISISEESVRPMNEIQGLEHGLDLPKHLAEHVNMLIGESVQVTFWFERGILNEIMDTFGNDILFTEEEEGRVKATVHVNEEAMQTWAEQHPTTVRVISPDKLVEDIRNDFRKALEIYDGTACEPCRDQGAALLHRGSRQERQEERAKGQVMSL